MMLLMTVPWAAGNHVSEHDLYICIAYVNCKVYTKIQINGDMHTYLLNFVINTYYH